MRRAWAIVIAVTLGVGGVATTWSQQVGTIVYLQGDIQVVRDEQVHTSDVDFGFPLQSYDEIISGDNSTVQLSVNTQDGLEATITVQPDTSFYLDLATDSNSQQGAAANVAESVQSSASTAVASGSKGAIELLAGAVGLDVRKMTDGSTLEVRTDSTIMAVRGTKFDVQTSVAGDVLVTVTDGKVQCDSDGGSTLFAEPDHAVENVSEGDFRNLPIANGTTVETFRQTWAEQRRAAFLQNAPRIVRNTSARYTTLHDRFTAAYRELMRNRAVLDRWIREDRTGAQIDPTQFAADRNAVLDALSRARAAAFLFERVLHRTNAMYRIYTTSSHWTDLSGFSSDEFFRRVENERPELLRQLRSLRYVLKLFAKRDHQPVPFERFGKTATVN